MNRNIISKLHTTAGLLSGIFILLMSLSGAVLVFHEKLDKLQTPKAKLSSDKACSIDLQYKALQQHFPHAQISNCTLPADLNDAMGFVIYDTSYKQGKTALKIFQHPQTAVVLEARGSQTGIVSWLSQFHASFHLGKMGEWLLGVFALIFLLSLLTGFVLFRKSITSVLFLRKGIFRKNNLHQIIGVYALLFNLMIAITGFWMQRYVFKKEFYAADTYSPVLKTSPPLSYNVDSVFVVLKKQYPDFTPSTIYFAQSKKGKTAIYGSQSSNSFIHSKKMADVIFLDSTGSIAKTRFINEINADDRYDIVNSQLHMGRYGGLGIQVIYLLFGLSGGFLSITGFLLWIGRRSAIA